MEPLKTLPGAIEGNCDSRKLYLIFIESLVCHQNDMQSSGRQQKHIGTHALSLLTRHKKAKWVAVDERALTKLLRSWPALIQDRLQFAASRSLDANTIYLQLISRKFLSYAHFVQNVRAECRSLQKNLNWNRDLNFLQKTMLRRGFQWDDGSNGTMGRRFQWDEGSNGTRVPMGRRFQWDNGSSGKMLTAELHQHKQHKLQLVDNSNYELRICS